MVDEERRKRNLQSTTQVTRSPRIFSTIDVQHRSSTEAITGKYFSIHSVASVAFSSKKSINFHEKFNLNKFSPIDDFPVKTGIPF